MGSCALFAQYQSGVTLADKDKPVVADESDPSVKYANKITAEGLKNT